MQFRCQVAAPREFFEDVLQQRRRQPRHKHARQFGHRTDERDPPINAPNPITSVAPSGCTSTAAIQPSGLARNFGANPKSLQPSPANARSSSTIASGVTNQSSKPSCCAESSTAARLHRRRDPADRPHAHGEVTSGSGSCGDDSRSFIARCILDRSFIVTTSSLMSAAGLSKSRLDRMHDTMNGHVARGELPGLVTLVCRRDEVHVDAIGNLRPCGAIRSRCSATRCFASRR